jgi:putative ABC transport system permease protein
MLGTVKSFGQYFRTYPLRGILTILTIGIGTGVLIVTFSLSFDVNNALDESLSGGGIRITIANGTLNEDGQIERQFPPAFGDDVVETLETDYENLHDTTVVRSSGWDRVSANGTSYQVRSVISAEAAYANTMDLEMTSGAFFTDEDVEERRRVVVISEETARILFGSVESAVGQQVSSAVPVANFEGGGMRMRVAQQPFEVVGVYQTVSELERESFGIGDFIIPLGIDRPAGFPMEFMPDSVVMTRVTNASVDSAMSRISAIMEVAYGEDTEVAVWEGSPSGPAPLIEESRKSVRSFALTINVLGVIVLIASSIGIFSIMLVEVLNRMREIGLRRALGATRAHIRRFFLLQALYFSALGSVLGVGLAVIFYRVIGRSLLPFFERSGLSATDLQFVAPGLLPIGLAVGAALLVGVVFGLFPAISASRTPIVETIREEAA